MSVKYLGENFDIHGGGSDLQFPHHENEIAQSKCGFAGSNFATYWIHNGFLNVDGEKMSKSLGNFITCEDFRRRGIGGEVVRFALLSSHYRKPINFTSELLENAEMSIKKFYHVLEGINYSKVEQPPLAALECLEDDFNMARYVALMFSYFKDVRDTSDIRSKEKIASQFFAMGKLIGIFNMEHNVKTEVVNSEVLKLAEERMLAKNDRDYVKSDRIRQEICGFGYEIEDLPNGEYLLKRID